MLGRILSRLRRYLVTGLIVVAPVGVTAWVLVWLFQRMDSILGRWLPVLGVPRFPGLGLLVLLALLLFVGWTLRWALGRKLVGWGNRTLSRLPFARRIYNATSQIAQTVLARQEKLFRSCALVEYPHPGSYTLAFVTARVPREVEPTLGPDGVTVFLPTVPNPTTGYLLLLPADRVRVLEMSVEDGMKMIISAGTVVPGREGAGLAGLDLDRLTHTPDAEAGPAGRPRRRRWRGRGERSPTERGGGTEGRSPDTEERGPDAPGDGGEGAGA